MKKNREFAVVYCEGAFNTTNGKTAHGLVRFSERFTIVAVIDSKWNGQDSGYVLDRVKNQIPVVSSLQEALTLATRQGQLVRTFVIGLAPDGGRLPQPVLKDIKEALRSKLNVVSGLHDFLSENEELVKLAERYHCTLTDVRKPPPRDQLHFFSGKIQEVTSLKIAILGTDSAVGKRTTAWKLVNGLRSNGYRAEMVGTGQTAWLQGARYSIILDSLVNDFVAGEIEHAIHEAWRKEHPHVIVIEGQGSLMNPAYPGGYEILAAGRPDLVILQHAPRRKEYDGFPGHPLHPINHQILAIEVVSGKKVSAITLNHEGMNRYDIERECLKLKDQTGIPAMDVLEDGADALVTLINPYIRT